MTDETRALLDMAAGDLAAARRDLGANDPRAAVSRAYYAVFHAAQAALHSEGAAARTHAGTGTSFSETFVKSGRLSRDLSKTLSALMRLRQSADYEVGHDVSIPDAADATARAGAFIEAIRAFLDDA